eukprot:3090941-Alexandrium_andersonii.AAC.1
MVKPKMLEMAQEAVKHDLPVLQNNFDDEELGCSRTLYVLLAQLTKGTSRRVVMNIEENNGIEAWRELHRQYQPQ